MRTHLLRTFYPSPDTEFDTGRASNDECYATDFGNDHAPAPQPSTQAALARDLAAEALLEAYEFGGYAGI